LHTIKYRAPGSAEWEEKSWDWTISTLTERIKKTRDSTWKATVDVNDKQVAVNRTEGLAWLGGAATNSEDCYLASKFTRSLGVVYLEHQARI
jgi:formate dehydrogenase major subunit